MADHTIHPREEWIDPRGPAWEGFPSSNGTPYKCPSFRGWAQIRDLVIHYPGADWADMDFTNDGRIDLNDDIAQIRVQHAFYARSRKYSLGYCYLIGQTGGIWESRGTRNTNAANLGQANKGTTGWNNYSISIQLIVDEQNAATAAQVNSVNWLLDELLRQKRAATNQFVVLNLRYHGQGQSTSCCGTGIIDQINRGIIAFGKSTAHPPEPKPEPKPPQPQPTPPGEDDTTMASTQLLLHDVRDVSPGDGGPWYKVGPTSMTWVRDGNALGQMLARVAECAGGTKVSPYDGFVWRQFNHGGNDVIACYGPIEGDVPPGRDRYGRVG